MPQPSRAKPEFRAWSVSDEIKREFFEHYLDAQRQYIAYNLKKSKGFEVENPHGFGAIGKHSAIPFFALFNGFFSPPTMGNMDHMIKLWGML